MSRILPRFTVLLLLLIPTIVLAQSQPETAIPQAVHTALEETPLDVASVQWLTTHNGDFFAQIRDDQHVEYRYRFTEAGEQIESAKEIQMGEMPNQALEALERFNGEVLFYGKANRPDGETRLMAELIYGQGSTHLVLYFDVDGAMLERLLLK